MDGGAYQKFRERLKVKGRGSAGEVLEYYNWNNKIVSKNDI